MFNFQNITGNEFLIESLKKSFNFNTIYHSYIFNGSAGLGKKLISFSFAKLILCENPNNENPCDKCYSCLTFENKNNPDVIFIESDKKTLGIDLIREEIIKEAYVKPFKSKYKIFIILKADTMTVQAQNSLLKIIENPPKHLKIFLLSENYNSLLPTILSRCIILKLSPLPSQAIKNTLISKHNINEEKSEIFSIYAQGSLGKALKISLFEEFIIMREDMILGLKDLLDKDLINLYNLVNKFERYKENVYDLLEILFLIYRDCIVFKNTQNKELIIQKDVEDLITSISKKFSNKKIIKSLDYILEAKTRIDKNVGFNMVMEYLFIKLKERRNA